MHQAVKRAADGIADVIVASDVLRGQPLLHKIEDMMSAADLCLFDLTLHNPNVAAEFGIAHGNGYKYAILYCTDEKLNPTPGRESSLFSDVKGWDSVLYSNPEELERKLRRYLPELLAAEAPASPSPLSIPRQAQAEHAFEVRPMMHLNLASGEGGPSGSFVNGVMRNVGRGVAFKPKLVLPGFGNVPIDHLLKANEPFDIRLRYDNEDFYVKPLSDRGARVEFEDELGNRYEQRGTVEQGETPGGVVLGYAIRGLDQPILIRG